MAARQLMKFKNLGNSGLKVSNISFGNWLNSNDQKNQQQTEILLKKAWDLGINYFDTAEVYGNGEAERQFASALKQLNTQRDQYVLSTKIFWGPTRETNPNDVGLSRKHIIEGLQNSLQRLDHKYVDVVFAHRFDQDVNLEETCRAFDWVIKQGYANYWGTSEWSAAQIFEAFAICNKYDLALPIADQCQYNMIFRENVDREYGRLFDIYNYGTTVWSPLAGGLLTGKYNNVQKLQDAPENSRFKLLENNEKIETAIKMKTQLQELEKISQKIGISQAQLSLAWVLKSKGVSSAIVGATKPQQLEETVKSIQAVDLLTDDILEEIEQILNNRPTPFMNYRTWSQMPHRR